MYISSFTPSFSWVFSSVILICFWDYCISLSGRRHFVRKLGLRTWPWKLRLLAFSTLFQKNLKHLRQAACRMPSLHANLPNLGGAQNSACFKDFWSNLKTLFAGWCVTWWAMDIQTNLPVSFSTGFVLLWDFAAFPLSSQTCFSTTRICPFGKAGMEKAPFLFN